MSFDNLKELKVLDSCLRETLRLHPPIITVMRKVVKPIAYKDFVIPVGDFLCASPAVTQLDPTLYPDPYTWNPHRWSSEDLTNEDELKGSGESIDYGFGVMKTGSAKSPYLPFGAGIRFFYF